MTDQEKIAELTRKLEEAKGALDECAELCDMHEEPSYVAHRIRQVIASISPEQPEKPEAGVCAWPKCTCPPDCRCASQVEKPEAVETNDGPYTCVSCTASTWNDSDWCDACSRPEPTP